MEPYELLANAVIKQCADDYRSALRRLRKHPEDTGALGRKLECERFFRSGWYRELTDIDPEYLIERLRKETDEK